MADTLSDPAKVLQHFEPGSDAAEFVDACTIAAGRLMQLIQGEWGHSKSLGDRAYELEQRIQVLQDTLENAIHVAGSVLEALKRLEADGDR